MKLCSLFSIFTAAFLGAAMLLCLTAVQAIADIGNIQESESKVEQSAASRQISQQQFFKTSADETIAPRTGRDLRRAVGELKNGAEPQQQPGIWNALKGLGLCLSLFFLGLYFFKRFRAPDRAVSTERIRVIERRMISQRTAVSLLEVDGRTILVSSGSESVSITELKGASKHELPEQRKGKKMVAAANSAPISLRNVIEEVTKEPGRSANAGGRA